MCEVGPWISAGFVAIFVQAWFLQGQDDKARETCPGTQAPPKCALVHPGGVQSTFDINGAWWNQLNYWVARVCYHTGLATCQKCVPPRWESLETWWWAGEPSDFGPVEIKCVSKQPFWCVWMFDVLDGSCYSSQYLRTSNSRCFWEQVFLSMALARPPNPSGQHQLAETAQAQTPARGDGRCSPPTWGQRASSVRCWRLKTDCFKGGTPQQMIGLHINFWAARRVSWWFMFL